MQRNVFERHPVDGFRTSKVESISVTGQGRRLFAGTSEGNLILYESRIENTASGTRHPFYPSRGFIDHADLFSLVVQAKFTLAAVATPFERPRRTRKLSSPW